MHSAFASDPLQLQFELSAPQPLYVNLLNLAGAI